MLTRRAATTMLAGIAAAPSYAWAAVPGPTAVFYDAVGPKLTCWHANIANAKLEPQGSDTAPALIQYAWRHPTKLVLYVASSNFVPMGQPDAKHHLTAFRIEEPGNLRPEQMVGPIHIHPNGHVVYVGNRASGTIERDGKKFAARGENAVTAFMIDQAAVSPRRCRRSTRMATTRAHSRSTPAGACWWWPISSRCRCARAIM
jgi:hypothetical protein